jgi:cellulose synthase/poly-beta-1,6-N-acetylglucosamine synthase-like glycosyltransferase
MLSWSIAILYLICLLVIFGYAVLQAILAILYLLKNDRQRPDFDWHEQPFVTIQLPVFNEKYVVERLIRTVANINYPSHQFEIQVLDDSTDETTEIIQKMIPELNEKGIHIIHLHRTDRKGFKAGALAEGLKKAQGEFIAIFDADFVPDREFLYQTLPYFQQKKVGVVQTRWEHLNREDSLLTQLQAFALDAHFSVEQAGRNGYQHFINFNGTAGIWRKSTIADAGGWQHDTLTEDLDLSYRAQMKGWRFVYLENVMSPAELPMAISALKNQQFRWIKGGAENFVKNGRKLLTTSNLRFSDRLHGLAHLFNSSVFLFILLMALLTVPLVFAGVHNSSVAISLKWMSLFFTSTLLLMFYYWFSYREKVSANFRFLIFFGRFIQFLTVSLGLSFNNSKGIIQAYMGKKTAFVRTPKFNTKQKNSWRKNAYLKNTWKWETTVELILMIYFLVGMLISIYFGYYGMVPFQLMLFLGFGAIVWFTLKEQRKN